MRIVVVGGGVIGLLTAMECVRAGAQIDLIDQSSIPSPWATSNDKHRAVRALHRGDAALTAAAATALNGWLDIERRLGVHFYHRVGSLTAMTAEEVSASLALLEAADASGQALAPEQLPARYPRIRFPAGVAAVLEPAAGVVLADRALTALARWLRDQPGVRMYPHCRVAGVGEAGTVWLADGDSLIGDRVVMAAGPWSRDLLPTTLNADLRLYRQSMLSYEPMPSREAWAGMPVIPALGFAHGAWLIPPVAGTPVRLSASCARRAVTQMTDRVTPAQWRGHLIDHFAELLAGFDPAAVTGAADGYYLAGAGGERPLLATSGDGVVWAYAACGGMSFKFAPLVARAIAGRALERPPLQTGLAPVDQPRRFALARREEFA